MFREILSLKVKDEGLLEKLCFFRDNSRDWGCYIKYNGDFFVIEICV